MVPIYDSDLAEKRWQDQQWQNYEFWEQVELRNRKRKRIWIISALVLFLIFSSIPVIMVRFEKWRGVRLARELSQELTSIKRDAATRQMAIKVSFRSAPEGLIVHLDEATHCQDSGKPIRETLIPKSEGFIFLAAQEGLKLGVPGLVSMFCYDPQSGFENSDPRTSRGVGILPAKDLTEEKIERLTLVTLEGSSAEISFE